MFHVPHLDEDAGPAGGPDNLLRFFHRRAERFLDQEVAPLLEQGKSHLAMPIGRNDHADGITGFPEGFERIESPTSVFPAHFVSPAPINLVDPDQVHPIKGVMDPGVMASEIADSGHPAF